MSYDIGPRIGIEGEAAFQASIKAINAQMKNLNSEMKASAAAFGKANQSQEKLAAQNKVLARSIEVAKEKNKLLTAQYETQKTKLSALEETLNKVKSAFGEQSEEAVEAQNAYNKQAKEVADLGTQLNKTAAELSGMEQEVAANSAAMEKAKAAASQYAQEQRQAEAAAKALKEQQERLAAQVSATSEKLNASAQAMGGVNRAAVVAAAAVGGLALAAGKVGADFEAQMSKVESISGATGQSLEELTAKAREMGATTKFTATEAGQALEYMAMAGWKPEQMLGGLEGIMNLAAASGENLASVSDIVTDALTAFGLKASDSAHFADVLATAAASSNTNVSMLGQTFQYAAPVAGALGYSVEDVAVAIGLMANAGIKGEKSGTALRGMLTNLAKPSDQVAGYLDRLGISLTDTAGEIKPLNTLLAEMRQEFAGLTEAQKAEYAAGIAGKEAMSGMLAVVNASDADFNNLTRAIDNSNGAAKNMADVMGRNLKGQLTLLKSAAEGAGIAFYEKFQGPVTDAVEAVTQKVSTFSQALASGELDTQLKLMATGAVAAGAALVGLNAAIAVKDVSNFLTFAKNAKAAGTALKEYEAATKAAALAQKALTIAQSMTPWAWVALAAGAAATAFVAYKAMTNDAADGSASLSSRIGELNETLEEQAEAQASLAKAREESVSGILTEVGAVEGYVSELKRITDENGRVVQGYERRAEYLSDQINNLIPGAVEANQDEAGAIYSVTEAIDEKIFALKKEMALEAMREEYLDALEKQKEAEKNVTEALKNQGVAQNELAEAKRKEEEATNPRAQEAYAIASANAEEKLRKATEAVNTARAAAEGYQQTINTFDATVATQSLEELDAILAGLSANIVRNTGSNQAELAKAVADMQLTYNRMVSEAQAAWAAATKEERAQWDRRLQTTKDALDRQVAEAIAGGLRIGEGLAEGTEKSAYQYPQEVQSLLNEGQAELEAAGVTFRQAGGKYVSELAAAMASGKGKPVGAVSAVVAAVVNEAAAAQSRFEAIGKYMMDGLAAGIQNNRKGPIGTAFDVAAAAAAAARKAAQVNSPSRVFREIGGYMSEGLAIGIADGKKGVADSSTEMARTALNATRKALDIHSPSVETMLLGAFAATGFALGMRSKLQLVKKTTRDLSDAVTKQLDSLNNQIAKIQGTAQKRQAKQELADYEKSLQEKRKTMEKQERELQEKLAKAKASERAKLEQEGLEAREKALADIAKLEADWNEKQLKAQEQAQQESLQSQIAALQEVGKEYEAALQELEGKQDTLSGKLKGYGELFTWVKDETREFLELGDLQKDIDMITAYGEALEQLKAGNENRRGVSESLLNEILSMDMDDALAYTDKLLKMTDTDYDKYLSKWEEKQKLADEVARAFYQKELDALDEEFAGKIPETMETLKTDLYEVGINAALGLAKGMWSERQTVINTAVRIAEMAYSESKKSQKINSPSKKWAELGGYMALGLGVGFTEQMQSVAREITASIPLPTAQTGSLERLGETVVNGMASAVQGGGQVIRLEIPIQLGKREIARSILPDLLDAAKQRGISLG